MSNKFTQPEIGLITSTYGEITTLCRNLADDTALKLLLRAYRYRQFDGRGDTFPVQIKGDVLMAFLGGVSSQRAADVPPKNYQKSEPYVHLAHALGATLTEKGLIAQTFHDQLLECSRIHRARNPETQVSANA